METIYDIIIVGSGPAGMTAAIYAKRAGMNCLVLEKMMPGGQIAITPKVENYPGFKSISGTDLSMLMFDQVKNFGVKTEFCEVLNIKQNGAKQIVETTKGVFESFALVLAMGASSRTLDAQDEQKFVGKGLSYCAVCDGAFFKDKVVAVVGGGNSAFEDVCYLANIAKKVVHINRRGEFRADQTNIDAYNKVLAQDSQKIEQCFGFVVEKLEGNQKLESVFLRNVKTNEIIKKDVDGVFVSIGRVPQTDILPELKLDEKGYVLVDGNMQTNIQGVFAAGDLTKKTLRQITTATSDGSIAGLQASVFVKKMKSEK